MKLFSLVAGLLVLPPAVASAQTQTQTEAQDVHDAPTFGGVKVGADIDYRWTEADHSLPRIASSINQTKGGIGYRVHVGYDAQVGNMLVIGAEGGIGRGGKTLSVASITGDYSIKPRWTWDVSGRVGVLAAPTVLLYGRAGYSWLRVREKTDFRAVASKDLSTSATEKGFLYGGGIETAISPGLFVRAEYNRVNYRDGLKTSRALLGVSAGF